MYDPLPAVSLRGSPGAASRARSVRSYQTWGNGSNTPWATGPANLNARFQEPGGTPKIPQGCPGPPPNEILPFQGSSKKTRKIKKPRMVAGVKNPKGFPESRRGLEGDKLCRNTERFLEYLGRCMPGVPEASHEG